MTRPPAAELRVPQRRRLRRSRWTRSTPATTRCSARPASTCSSGSASSRSSRRRGSAFGLVVLLVSIVVCTLDRTPRLWRQSARHPRRPARPVLRPAAARPGARWRRSAAGAVRDVLRRHRFRAPRGRDRRRPLRLRRPPPYTKMATLLTHLGLILFLVAAAVTAGSATSRAARRRRRRGTARSSRSGRPGLLIVKNLGFEAPRRPDGQFADFTTDLAVYQDGQRAGAQDDPGQRSALGRRLHVPPERLRPGAGPRTSAIAQADVLWDGPGGADRAVRSGLPRGVMGDARTGIGLELSLDQLPTARPGCSAVPYRVIGVDASGDAEIQYGGRSRSRSRPARPASSPGPGLHDRAARRRRRPRC